MKTLFEGMSVASIPIFIDMLKMRELDTGRIGNWKTKEGCVGHRQRMNEHDATITSLKVLSSLWAGLVGMGIYSYISMKFDQNW